MRICNILLDKPLDDTARGFLDHIHAQLMAGHFVGGVTHPKADMNSMLDGLDISHTTFKISPVLDNNAFRKLGAFIRTLRSDVVIAYGERAVQAARKAIGQGIPLVAVVQEYQFQHLHQAEAIFALTRHMMEAIHREAGIPMERMYHIPGMVQMDTGGFIRRTWREPPVIGARGEFTPQGGFDVWLHALALVKAQGMAFRARIAGAGEEGRALKKLARHLGLEGCLEWVDAGQETHAFYDSLDMFCVPPHHAPFGRELLEAMAQKLPVVVTDAEGPAEIIAHQHSGLVVPRADAQAMADALMTLLVDESYARDLAGNAWRTVKQHYEIGRMSAHISEVLAYIHACQQQAQLSAADPILT